MYRYQYSGHLSRDVLPAARHNLHKLGRIVRVEAKRYDASVKSLTDATGRTKLRGQEVIRVVGTRGTATFTGVSWGYGGEGPRATEAVLLMCGVPTNEAQHHLAPFAAGVDAAEVHDEVGVTQKLVAVSLVGVMV